MPSTTSADQISSVFSRQLRGVIALTILSTLLGGVVASLLKSYQATIALPVDGDLMFARMADQEIRTQARQSAYAISRKTPQERAAFERLTELIERRTLQIDQSFALTRRDILDLPDFAAKDLKLERPARLMFRVISKDADPQSARRSALDAIEYIRDTLLLLRSELLLTNWRDEPGFQRNEIEHELVNRRLQVGSLSRQIEAMEKLQLEPKHSVDQSQVGSQPNSDQIQVQVQVQGHESGKRYLSPLRQIVALRSALIDENEKLNTLNEKLDYLNELRAFSSSTPPSELAQKIRTTTPEPTEAGGPSDKQGLGKALARAEIRKQVSKSRQDIANAVLEPADPVVQKVGGGVIMILLGAMIGLLLGLAWNYAGMATSWWKNSDGEQA